jgi:hypothetical protein
MEQLLLLLSPHPLLKKIEVGIQDHHCLSLSLCIPPPTNFECLNSYLRNLACISWQLSPSLWRTSKISHQSLCLYVYTPIFARQRLGIDFSTVTNTLAKLGELMDMPFSM